MKIIFLLKWTPFFILKQSYPLSQRSLRVEVEVLFIVKSKNSSSLQFECMEIRNINIWNFLKIIHSLGSQLLRNDNADI